LIKKWDKIGFLFFEKFPVFISTKEGGFISFFGAILLFLPKQKKSKAKNCISTFIRRMNLLTFFAEAEKSKAPRSSSEAKKLHFNFHKAFPTEHSVFSLRAFIQNIPTSAGRPAAPPWTASSR
jgi:hypothetical protein